MKQIPEGILNWLSETLNRIFIKQPKYFKYWTWVSYLLMGISGIPYVLVQFNLSLPEPFASLSNKAITGAAIAVWAMSKLTVKSPIVGVTVEGSAIKVTDEKKLPFTDAAEKKQAAKEVPPPEVLEEVPEVAPDSEKKD